MYYFKASNCSSELEFLLCVESYGEKSALNTI